MRLPLVSTSVDHYIHVMLVPRDLDDLMTELMTLRDGHGSERGVAPVELWNPPECGDIGMEIRADGSWWHQGARITRQPLIDLFATVLRKDEDGRTWLVTPGEKVIVHVQDAHFLGTRVDQVQTSHGAAIAVTTNVGDLAVIGPQHPLRVVTDPITQEPRPYVRVRGRLEARILRAPFYELVALAHENAGGLEITSHGMAFSLGNLEGHSA
jgi:uncharacterized protein